MMKRRKERFQLPLQRQPQSVRHVSFCCCVQRRQLYFYGMPFENEQDFGEAIGILSEAIASYDPELYGYRFDDEIAPGFNFGASPETGVKMAVPVKYTK